MKIAKTKRGEDINLIPKRANRHGLITGSTGTGKTVTLRCLIEHFSSIGVPVFVSDVKPELSGIVQPGSMSDKPEGFPVQFWDLYGQLGQPIRTTCLDMGDLLLSRLLDLTRVQTGIMTLLFKVVEDNGMRLVDLSDVKAMLEYLADHSYDFKKQYGNITFSSVGVIQREILALQKQGVDNFFDEPSFDIGEFFRADENGRGVVNILQADTIIKAPKLYCTFLLWLLSEVYEKLDEVGDLEKPRFVFFFDEAHLLFKDIPEILLDKIEQIVRLIRSKGVGVYFVTQSPLDIPESVLAQLGNRIQHALRAFTPKDRRVVKVVAETFRDNPNFNVSKAITELKIGEALISFLQDDGSPGMVERAKILPPRSRLEPLHPDEIREYIGDIDMQVKEDDNRIILTQSGPMSVEKTIQNFGRGVVRAMGNRVGNEIVRGFFNTFIRGSRGGLGR